MGANDNLNLNRVFDRASVFMMKGTSFRRGHEAFSVEAVPETVKLNKSG